MRARVLRAAIADVQELRKAAALADERVAAVQTEMGAQLAEAQRRAKYQEGFAADLDCMLERVLSWSSSPSTRYAPHRHRRVVRDASAKHRKCRAEHVAATIWMLSPPTMPWPRLTTLKGGGEKSSHPI